MANVLVRESSLEDIADAIRNKLNVQTTYKPGEMAAAITSIPSGGSTINNQNKTVHPSSSQQSITADSGYTGLGTVTVKGVTIANLSPSNIVSGVTIKIGDADDDDAIASVTGTASGGGGILLEDVNDKTLSGAVVINSTSLRAGLIADCTGVTSVSCPNATQGYSVNIGGGNRSGSQFARCTGITTASLPVLTSMPDYLFSECTNLASVSVPRATTVGVGSFSRCSSLTTVVLPSLNGIIYASGFEYCTSLTTVDTYKASIDRTNAFKGCSALNTLIFRRSDILVKLSNLNNFDGTPFASSGTGGTIYIPKTLYDHLGDNSSLDYKAANNWSTINGYGTITWAKIEGSYYETHYADGSLIS